MGSILVPLDAGITRRGHRLHFHGFERMERKARKGSESLWNELRSVCSSPAQLVWKRTFKDMRASTEAQGKK